MATYEENFKKKIVKLHIEGGRTIRSLSDEFHISKNGISYWIKKYREECQTNPAAKRCFFTELIKLAEALFVFRAVGNVLV